MRVLIEPSARLTFVVQLLLATFAVILCWKGVSWALRPGLFLAMDELGNLTRFVGVTVWQTATFFPHAMYNDRPVGFALEEFLFRTFSFDYHRQVICFLAIHFANCGLGFLLFRRLAVGIPLSVAGIGFYGSLWTTASTATYVGAVFDVLALFLLLTSAMLLLSEKRGATVLSACLLILAMRTKEFAIVFPVIFFVLALFAAPPLSARQTTIWIARRLWIHIVIGIAYGIAYLSLIPLMKAQVLPSNPYYMHLDASTILNSFSYYIALIVGREESSIAHQPLAVALILGTILVYSLFRRDMAVLFSLAAFMLILLPVSTLPNQRTGLYAYAPQMFLILLVCLLLERLFAFLWKREAIRWDAAVGVALLLMSWAVVFRESSYFKNRIAFTLMMRKAGARTAADAQVLIPQLVRGAHIYVNHGDQTPWLLVMGPCAYFEVTQRDRALTCVINQPEDTLRKLYMSDHGPKYFVDYKEGGALTVVDASPHPN